jgi:hypothetical protein
MNRVITTGLFVFALAALTAPNANADTRLRQQLRLTPSHTEPIQAIAERSETEKAKVNEPQTKPLATAQPTATQPLSERDRLILERQQLRLIPRQ